MYKIYILYLYRNITRKLTKLYKNKCLKIIYNANIFELVIHDKNGIYKMKCFGCNNYYIHEMKEKLHDTFLQLRYAFLKPKTQKLIYRPT